MLSEPFTYKLNYLFHSKKLNLIKMEEQEITDTLTYRLLETQTETSVPQSNSYMDFIVHPLHLIYKCYSLLNFVKTCIS